MIPELLLSSFFLLGAYSFFYVTFIKQPRCKSVVKLHGKTAIVTGANTGIGRTTALDLARRGCRVVLACRDRQRAEAAVHDIIQETGNRQVVYMQLDLASLKSVRSFARDFLKAESRLDLLINNAGLMVDGQTEDGFGMIFGVNHLGHFLLTVLLLERLKASGRSRVVTVASAAYAFGSLDLVNLAAHKDFGLETGGFQLFKKYSHSKLCNILFTLELHRRLQGSDVTCYSLHPGAIRTEISRHFSVWLKVLLTPVSLLLAVDSESGAQTTLHCALEPGIEPLSGRYFTRCTANANMEAKARDAAAATKLWELSERFCGL